MAKLPSIDDSHSQRLWMHTNARKFITTFDNGVDNLSFFLDSDVDVELGARARVALSSSSKGH